MTAPTSESQLPAANVPVRAYFDQLDDVVGVVPIVVESLLTHAHRAKALCSPAVWGSPRSRIQLTCIPLSPLFRFRAESS